MPRAEPVLGPSGQSAAPVEACKRSSGRGTNPKASINPGRSARNRRRKPAHAHPASLRIDHEMPMMRAPLARYRRGAMARTVTFGEDSTIPQSDKFDDRQAFRSNDSRSGCPFAGRNRGGKANGPLPAPRVQRRSRGARAARPAARGPGAAGAGRFHRRMPDRSPDRTSLGDVHRREQVGNRADTSPARRLGRR